MASFELTFAGVPFLIDEAHEIRLDAPQTHVYEDASQLPPRRYQPLVDIIDEINRMISTQYLYDFTPPNPYPGRNLGAISHPSKVWTQPSAQLRINDWYYPYGATRHSVFRGLASSSQYRAMLAATNDGRNSATFVMRAVPTNALDPANYTVSTRMRMLPGRVIGEHGGDCDGLYLMTLVDERFYFVSTPLSIKLQSGMTWKNLIDAIADTLKIEIEEIDIDEVYGKPELDSQLWANQESAAVLFDAVAANIGRIVVRKLSGTYVLIRPDESRTLARKNRSNVDITRIAGGELFYSGNRLPITAGARNTIVPSRINVTFPYYVVGDDPVPHFLNARYQNQRRSAWFEESYGGVWVVEVPIASGGPFVNPPGYSLSTSGVRAEDDPDYRGLFGTGIHYIHDTAKALISGEIQARSYPRGGYSLSTSGIASSGETMTSGEPINASGLTSLAMRLAADRYGNLAGPYLDEVLPGTIAWDMEGFHDVIWSYSARIRQGSTRVMRGSWTNTYDRMHHGYTLSGFTPVPRGVGGPSVAQTHRDYFAASGTFIGIGGGVWTVSGTIGSGYVIGSGNGNSGYLITSGTYTSGDVIVGSGAICTRITQSLTSGDTAARFLSVDYFPTGNRWRGAINREVILFEGTSGGVTLSGVAPRSGDDSSPWVRIVCRGIDGTEIAAIHDNQSIVSLQTPNVAYGVNLVNYGKGQFSFPDQWTSGGIQGVEVVPQVQTVRVLDGGGIYINRYLHHSGRLTHYDPTIRASGPWIASDFVWVIDRNASLIFDSGLLLSGPLSGGFQSGNILSGDPLYSGSSYSGMTFSGQYFSGAVLSGQLRTPPLTSGSRYEGQLLGYSQSLSGRAVTAPVYGVSHRPGEASTSIILAQLTEKKYANTVFEGGTQFIEYGYIPLYDDIDAGSPISVLTNDPSLPAFHEQDQDLPVYPFSGLVATSGFYYSGANGLGSGIIANASGEPIISGIPPGGYMSGAVIYAGGLAPKSFVRLRKNAAGNAYTIDQSPFIDIVDRTAIADGYGTVGYHYIWNQYTKRWMRGLEVRITYPE